MEQPVFDHEGPWTEAAYLALPRTDRVEVVEGTLLVGPSISEERSAAVAVVRAAIEAALPEGLHVRGRVALRLGPDCVLVPDLVVTAVEASGADAGPEAEADSGADSEADSEADSGADSEADPADSADHSTDHSTDHSAVHSADHDGTEVLDAAAALMVVEVIGREHGAVDRSFKPQLYAGCRIPYLLLVDHHGPFAVADMIISGRYHEYARAHGDEPLRLEEPFRLDLDLRAVTGAPEEPSPVG